MATARDNLARKQIFIPATQPETELCLRVAAYCRVSTDSEDQLNSFAAQNEHYMEMISTHERWELVDIYADEGISGRSARKRDDFQRLVNDCRKGRIDKVLVKSISRFARNTAECLETIRELRSLGISIFFEEHNIDTSMVSSEMLTAVLAACAQAESESISKNMRWSYRRCTWKRNGKAKIVWRCISRLDYGTTYCHDSPTMEEGILQQAIMDAINSSMSSKGVLSDQLSEAMQQELLALPGSTMTLGEVKRRLEEREAEFGQLLAVASEGGTEAHLSRFSTLSSEITELKRQQEELASLLRTNSRANLRLHKAMSAVDQLDHHMTEWDEQMIRQIVHTVKVISAERIKVILTDGTEIYQEVRKQ